VKLKIDGTPVTITLWDPAGQERFEAIGKSYFQRLNGVMLVFDLTNFKSFSNIQKWHQQISNSVDVPLMIVGNKCDDLSQRCLDETQIAELKRDYEFLYLTSAQTGENVDDAFNKLIENVVRRKLLMDEQQGINNTSAQVINRRSEERKRASRNKCCR
jgi:small GTP-binding protein